MNCNRKDCRRDAQTAMKMVIPAKGWELDKHAPMTAMMDIKVCNRCFSETDVKTFLTDDFKKMVNIILAKKCPPDFERAYLVKVPLDSKEYQSFVKAQLKGAKT